MPKPVLPEPLRRRRRRARVVYAAVVVAALAAVGLVMGLVIGTGEAAHATLVTSPAAAPVPGGTPRPDPTPVWTTDDHPASGDPLAVGTVVTWSTHRLAGRDAVTGAVRWSYTRTDLDICDAAQVDGRAFVLFRRGGNCDELSTFAAGTGARGWFRTMPDDGAGRLLFGAAGLVVAYPGSFHVMETSGGIDRYPSVPVTGAGCTFTAVVPGATGILVSERCGDGDHLALWSNLGEKSEPKQLWRVAVDRGVVALAASDTTVFDYDATRGAVVARSVNDGGVLGPVGLTPTPSGPARAPVVADTDVLLPIGGEVYAVSEAGAPQWSTPTTGSPTTVDAAGTAVFVPTPAGTAELDETTGTTTLTYAFTTAVTGDDPRVYPAGGGLLVAGAGLAYLR